MQVLIQLALDFFGGPEPIAPPERKAPPQVDAAAPVKRRKVAEPPPPALPLSDVLPPATWPHPRANRLVKLPGCDVAYEFKRGQRRTIGLRVTGEGLSVSAPRWTPVGEVEALLHSKSAWVLDKLQSARHRAGELAQARPVWADGAELRFLGQRVRLVLDPSHSFAEAGAVLDPPAPQADGSEPVARLRLGLAHSATEAQIRDAAQAWLMRQARRVFTERLAHFAPRVGVQHKSLRLSSAGTRWGSASVDGSIRLNWRLIHLGMDLVDYVVVHELSHLRHMDHSPRFWAVVAGVMPDYAERRLALKRAPVPLKD
ncbi:MAG: M48 family metallopeptidase [Hydrogenophaga sp.]|jgi:predicted metal-dependent hydrolase|nr:M48 family metallopeptidase [Hydrogenophaga sp.]